MVLTATLCARRVQCSYTRQRRPTCSTKLTTTQQFAPLFSPCRPTATQGAHHWDEAQRKLCHRIMSARCARTKVPGPLPLGSAWSALGDRERRVGVDCGVERPLFTVSSSP